MGLSTYEIDADQHSHSNRLEETMTEELRDSVLRTFVRNVYQYHNNEIFAVLRNEYTDWELTSRNNDAILRHNLYESLSDGLIVAPLMEVLRYHTGLKNGRTYLYHLNFPPSPVASVGSMTTHAEIQHNIENEKSGSYHNDGIFYFLGLSLIINSNSKSAVGRLSEDIEVSEQLITYVGGFCYAG